MISRSSDNASCYSDLSVNNDNNNTPADDIDDLIGIMSDTSSVSDSSTGQDEDNNTSSTESESENHILKPDSDEDGQSEDTDHLERSSCRKSSYSGTINTNSEEEKEEETNKGIKSKQEM